MKINFCLRLSLNGMNYTIITIAVHLIAKVNAQVYV